MRINRRKFLWGSAGVIALAGVGGGGYMLSRPSLLQDGAKSRADSVTTTDQLPSKADVAIIGGGIVGIMSAMYLKEKGYDVVVLEKGVIAGEQSSRAFGWISSLGDSPRRLALAAPTGTIWRGLSEKLGVDTSYRQNGLMFECADDDSIAFWEQWAKDHPEQGGSEVKILRGADLAARLPGGASENWHAAVLQPMDGSVEPPLAVPQIARALTGQGLKIVQNCAVRGLETSGGAVSGVVTEKGMVACQSVVVAGGAWTRLFLQNVGIPLPLLRVYSYMLRVPEFANGPVGAAAGGGTAWRKEVGGGYSIGNPTNFASVQVDSFRFLPEFAGTVWNNWESFQIVPNRELFDDLAAEKSWKNEDVTPFEKQRVLAPKPERELAENALAGFKKAFPHAADVQVIETWGGVIDMTPDQAPIIQKIDKIPGLVVAAGMSGHGLSMAPAAGQLVAELIANETQTIVDPKEFLASRF